MRFWQFIVLICFQLKRFHTKKNGKPPKPDKKKPGGAPSQRPVQEAEGPENEALEAEIRGLSSLSPDDFNKKFEKMLVRKGFLFFIHLDILCLRFMLILG